MAKLKNTLYTARMDRFPKNQSAPLNVTPQARHRVFIGLGWDPHQSKNLLEKAKTLATGRKSRNDLDLICALFDRNGHYINHVSAQRGHESDQTGKIYHSGDNLEGLGEGDDEQISVELKDLDLTITNIVFAATIKTGQTFTDIGNSQIHISDGYTNRRFLQQNLNTLPDNDKNAFVFIRLYKTPQNAWMLQNISEFLLLPTAADCKEILKPYTRL